jgi:hypothetical protein
MAAGVSSFQTEWILYPKRSRGASLDRDELKELELEEKRVMV